MIRITAFFVLLGCFPVLESTAQETAPMKTQPGSEANSTAASETGVEIETESDPMRDMQSEAVRNQKSDWAHWGNQPDRFSTWLNHSNRLIPVYTFGITLDSLRAKGSPYADASRLQEIYGRVPEGTLNPTALYYDQTEIYHLQQTALDAGFTNIIVMVFDGMDWQTTRAAALYHKHRNAYQSGRGTGLAFQDDRSMPTDFGLIVTSPLAAGAKYDVDAQTVISGGTDATGGYDASRGGQTPWDEQAARPYLMGLDRDQPHTVTDSAASATSLFSGIKTYNGAINVTIDGTYVTPIARKLQSEQDYMIGVVTSVPVSHATPAAAYANNVTRKDYQDLSRDMLGLPSSSHRRTPLPGVDVLIGGGWGEGSASDKVQGQNFMSGNTYLHQDDIAKVDTQNGGRYVVAQRTGGQSGRQVLMSAADQAVKDQKRLLGYFGVRGGHLPFQTADGKYNPTFDAKGSERYTPGDVSENPTLADMTEAALRVLERSIDGFWLMVEAGDVDWANHANNLDNSIGAVFSGESAFEVVMDWIDENKAADYTAVIVTSDHGHYLVIDDVQRIIDAGN